MKRDKQMIEDSLKFMTYINLFQKFEYLRKFD